LEISLHVHYHGVEIIADTLILIRNRGHDLPLFDLLFLPYIKILPRELAS